MSVSHDPRVPDDVRNEDAEPPGDDTGLYAPPHRYERDIPVTDPGPGQARRVRGGDPGEPPAGPSPEPPRGADSTDPAP